MPPLHTLDLFAGAGGSLLAGALLGWKAVAAVEIDPFCRAVLAHRWPNLELHDDVRTFPAERYAGIDIVTAGFPCQPFSLAGRRRGADDERNLWPDTARVLRLVRPGIAFLENTPGLVASGYLETVLGDLAEIGFDAEWTVLSAQDVGAPHLRERVWILAYTNGRGLEEHQQRNGRQIIEECRARWRNAVRCDVGDALRDRLQGQAHREAGCLPLAASPSSQPRLGRDSDELARWLDSPTRWPARRGAPQEAWEPPRAVTGKDTQRNRRLKALGNGWVPHQAVEAFRILAQAVTTQQPT